MRFQVRMGEDGSLEVRVLDGTFDQASVMAQGVIATLRARGIRIEGETQPESHTHDREERTHTHAHQ